MDTDTDLSRARPIGWVGEWVNIFDTGNSTCPFSVRPWFLITIFYFLKEYVNQNLFDNKCFFKKKKLFLIFVLMGFILTICLEKSNI